MTFGIQIERVSPETLSYQGIVDKYTNICNDDEIGPFLGEIVHGQSNMRDVEGLNANRFYDVLKNLHEREVFSQGFRDSVRRYKGRDYLSEGDRQHLVITPESDVGTMGKRDMSVKFATLEFVTTLHELKGRWEELGVRHELSIYPPSISSTSSHRSFGCIVFSNSIRMRQK